MLALVVLTAVMVGTSAALKLRATSRRGLGPRPLTLLEALVAIGLVALSLVGSPPATGFVRWSIPAAVVLMVTSSVDHAIRLARLGREREESEAGRLATYIEYPMNREGED